MLSNCNACLPIPPNLPMTAYSGWDPHTRLPHYYPLPNTPSNCLRLICCQLKMHSRRYDNHLQMKLKSNQVSA